MRTSLSPSIVARLGAARFADREAAERALEALGRRALPALKDALDDKDAEVRTRAAALVGRIEGALLTQASPVSFDFADVPLPDVVKAIGEQTGATVKLMPEGARFWVGRKVTLHEPKSLPFWTAIDRLCKAARLNYSVSNGFPTSRESSLVLSDARVTPTTPVFDSGPFRVILLGLHYQRDVTFPPTPLPQRLPGVEPPKEAGLTIPPDVPGPLDPSNPAAIHSQFHAQLQVIAEPRLRPLAGRATGAALASQSGLPPPVRSPAMAYMSLTTALSPASGPAAAPLSGALRSCGTKKPLMLLLSACRDTSRGFSRRSSRRRRAWTECPRRRARRA